MATRQSRPAREPTTGVHAWAVAVRRLLGHVAAAYAAQVELHERAWLRQEPWREELLHWSHDGEEWQLHGTRLPTSGGGRASVTRSGWCPAQRTGSGAVGSP